MFTITKHAKKRLKARFGIKRLDDLFQYPAIKNVIESMGDGKFRSHNYEVVIKQGVVITVNYPKLKHWASCFTDHFPKKCLINQIIS